MGRKTVTIWIFLIISLRLILLTRKQEKLIKKMRMENLYLQVELMGSNYEVDE